jgi:hypothetical protein
MNAFSKTAPDPDRTNLPPLVAQAVALANDLGFIHGCIPHPQGFAILATTKAAPS